MPPAWKRWAGLRSFWCITSGTSSARKHRPAKNTFTFYNLESTRNKTYTWVDGPEALWARKQEQTNYFLQFGQSKTYIRNAPEALWARKQEALRPSGQNELALFLWARDVRRAEKEQKQRTGHWNIVLSSYYWHSWIISFFLGSSENIHICWWNVKNARSLSCRWIFVDKHIWSQACENFYLGLYLAEHGRIGTCLGVESLSLFLMKLRCGLRAVSVASVNRDYNTNTARIQIHREVWVLQRMGGLTHCGGGRQEGGEDKEMSQEGDEGGCRWPAVATYLRKWYKYNCKKTVASWFHWEYASQFGWSRPFAFACPVNVACWSILKLISVVMQMIYLPHVVAWNRSAWRPNRSNWMSALHHCCRSF